MMSRPLRAPYEIPYGAAFGAQRAGGKRRHNGTDYHAPPGTPIYATGHGVVEHVGYNGDPWLGLGHNITIRYPDGKTLDAHLQNRTPLKVGQRVTPDTLVGHVGRTGNAVNADPKGPWDGNHLHHERRNLKGLLVNPEVYYGPSPAYASGTPIITLPNPGKAKEEEDDDMAKNSGFYYSPSAKTTVYLLCNTISGWYHEYTQGTNGGPMPGEYNNEIAGAFDTGPFAKITASHAAAIKRACDAVRTRTIAGDVSVTIEA